MEVEAVALEMWPAAVVQTCGGWLLRATQGVTSRANSVWPCETNGRLSTHEKIEIAEAFYQAHRLPAKFQINPASQPSDLGEILARRGYGAMGATDVQTAVLQTALTILPTINHNLTLTLSNQMDDSWLLFHQQANGYDAHALQMRRGIMSRISAPIVHCSAWQVGQIVGIGTAVTHKNWLCILNMRVADVAQRRGVGTAVLHKLLQWGARNNAAQAFLQVVAQNAKAKALYQKAAFKTVYQYEYYVK